MILKTCSKALMSRVEEYPKCLVQGQGKKGPAGGDYPAPDSCNDQANPGAKTYTQTEVMRPCLSRSATVSNKRQYRSRRIDPP